MSVILFKELWHGRIVSDDANWRTQYKRIFLIQTDDPTDGQMTVGQWEEIPTYGDHYKEVDPNNIVDGEAVVLFEDASSGLVGRELKQDDDNWMFWLLTCTYDSDGVDPDKANKDPMARTPEVEWGTFLTKEALEHDQENIPIANSAGDPYIPPITEDGGYRTLVVVQNEASFDPIATQKYHFKTNFADWKGFAPGQAYCRPINAKRQWERGVRFWKVRYEIHIADPEKLNNAGQPAYWLRRVLDRGKRAIPGGGTAPAPVTAGGQPTQTEILLDGAGHALATGGTAVYREFITKGGIDFNTLPIGDIGV